MENDEHEFPAEQWLFRDDNGDFHGIGTHAEGTFKLERYVRGDLFDELMQDLRDEEHEISKIIKRFERAVLAKGGDHE